MTDDVEADVALAMHQVKHDAVPTVSSELPPGLQERDAFLVDIQRRAADASGGDPEVYTRVLTELLMGR